MGRPRTDPASSYRMPKLPSDPGGIEPPTLTQGWVNNDVLPDVVVPSPSPAQVNLPSDPFQSGYSPGDNVETPYRHPILGNKDWIRENWNQYDPSGEASDAISNWTPESPQPPMDYSHPDDALFFSPSREISKTYSSYPPVSNTPSVGSQFPFWKNPTNLSPFFSQLNSRQFFQGNRPDYNGPLSHGDETVGQGQVLVGNEQATGSAGGAIQGDIQGGSQYTPTEVSPDAEARGAAETAQLKASGQLTPDGLPPGTPGATSRQPQQLFGRGQDTGQHYYSNNGGKSWIPIGQAPQDARWAPNSGTGNFQADQTAQGFTGWNPADSVTNDNSTPEGGQNLFRSGVWQLDPEGGYSYMGPTTPGARNPTGQLINDPASISAYNARATGIGQ